MSDLPIVVVGGGTSGSLVVIALAQSTDHEIIVVEPGIVSSHDKKNQFLDTLSPELLWPNINVSPTSTRAQMPYLQARALGGGSAINGLILSGQAPSEFIELTRLAREEEIGPLSQAFIACGAVPSQLWWNGGRWNPARAVAHLVDEGRVTWIHKAVDTVVHSDNSVVGVLVDSQFLESSVVVLCAGALLTPALLLASGIGAINPAIGIGVQNHPTVSFTLKKKSTDHAKIWFDASVVLRATTSQGKKYMAIMFERLSRDDASNGIVSVSLLDVVSRGVVRFEDGKPSFEFNMLDDVQDKVAMREAVRHLIAVVQRKEFKDVVEQVFIDDKGTPLSQIQDVDDADLDAWIFTHLAMVSHASSSCNGAVDSVGKVHGMGNLFVADASVLKSVPHETPAASVTIEAMRIARAIGDSLR